MTPNLGPRLFCVPTKAQDCALRLGAVADRARASSDCLMFFPAGDHRISPSSVGGGAATITVRIDSSTADVLNASLGLLNTKLAPHRAFIDRDHSGKEVIAWPQSFFWQDYPDPGVYMAAEFSDLGRRLVTGKAYRSFSPSFFTDADLPKVIAHGQHIQVEGHKRGSPMNPSRVILLAGPNIGTVTNNPAFKKIRPLWE